jgi:hypothetical protein
MKRNIDFQGKKVEGETVNFKVISPEQWYEYQLQDGTILRVKTILATVIRLPEFNPDGDPIYVINTQNHVVIGSVQEDLRKPK